MERNAEASADRNRSSFLGNLNDMVANSVENQLARGVEAEFAQSSRAANDDSGPASSPFRNTYFLARITEHLDFCNLHVAVLGITLLHTRVLGHFFGVFLQIVHLRMRDNPGCGDRVTHMFGKSHSTTPHFPRAPIISCQQELMSAVTFGQTACDISHVRF